MQQGIGRFLRASQLFTITQRRQAGDEITRPGGQRRPLRWRKAQQVGHRKQGQLKNRLVELDGAGGHAVAGHMHRPLVKANHVHLAQRARQHLFRHGMPFAIIHAYQFGKNRAARRACQVVRHGQSRRAHAANGMLEHGAHAGGARR
ncbi:hypothetical protein D3C72_1815400 [compost metagenome]